MPRLSRPLGAQLLLGDPPTRAHERVGVEADRVDPQLPRPTVAVVAIAAATLAFGAAAVYVTPFARGLRLAAFPAGWWLPVVAAAVVVTG